MFGLTYLHQIWNKILQMFAMLPALSPRIITEKKQTDLQTIRDTVSSKASLVKCHKCMKSFLREQIAHHSRECRGRFSVNLPRKTSFIPDPPPNATRYRRSISGIPVPFDVNANNEFLPNVALSDDIKRGTNLTGRNSLAAASKPRIASIVTAPQDRSGILDASAITKDFFADLLATQPPKRLSRPAIYDPRTGRTIKRTRKLEPFSWKAASSGAIPSSLKDFSGGSNISYPGERESSTTSLTELDRESKLKLALQGSVFSGMNNDSNDIREKEKPSKSMTDSVPRGSRLQKVPLLHIVDSGGSGRFNDLHSSDSLQVKKTSPVHVLIGESSSGRVDHMLMSDDGFQSRDVRKTSSFRRPPYVVCYICERKFAPNAIAAHETQCLQKWKIQNSSLPANQRKPVPRKSAEARPFSAKSTYVVDSDESPWESSQNHFPCDHCGRVFPLDRLLLHQKTCKKGKQSVAS